MRSKATTSEVALTREQNRAVERLLAFEKNVQTLGGYAGTGKTTVIRELKAALPGFAVCAFTGKAAHVLRRKGLKNASTIHSLIYDPKEIVVVDSKGKEHTRVVFERKPEMEAKGFIVDEASMVSRSMYEDLLAFHLPMIFVGDHGQLEPVEGYCDLMVNPDITLEKIHRNAGEIAHFAAFVREGNTPANWRRHKDYSGDSVWFMSLNEACEAPIADFDQMICAKNKTRVAINEVVRANLPDHPVAGDRVMCLQNDSTVGVFNGQQGTVEAVWGDAMDFLADGQLYRVRFQPEQFNNPIRVPRSRDGALPFDFCYMVTCHKSQGDEWDKVLVFEQKLDCWDHKRWAYTAATRARKSLTWVPHERM